MMYERFPADGAPKLLSDMLDEPEEKPQKKPKKSAAKPPPSKKKKQQEEENEDEDEDVDEDEDEDEGIEVEYEEDEEDGEEAHDALLKAMGSLDKSSGKQDAKKRGKSRAAAAHGLELLEEAEFAAGSEEGLSMQDLMGSLAQVNTADLKKLKTRLVKLHSEKKAQPVEVPLEEVHQHAAERKVTYDTVKHDVNRWIPTITKNRLAKTLEFPLNEPRTESITSASLQSQFKPSNDLELDLQNILEQYGYTASAMKKKEAAQLEQRELSPQEAQERQLHLAQLKSLLFYHEIKQKRLKKIKSKQYHKLKKKREEGKKLSAEEQAMLSSEGAHEMKMSKQIDRIKERMTQRHKNTSKWAKKQLQLMKNQRMTSGLKDSRSAIEQQLDAHQKLLHKDEDEDEGRANNREMESSEDDEEDEDEDPEVSRARFKARVEELNSSQGPDTTKLKGLAGLKFMQKANERKQAETAKLFEDALKEGEEEEGEEGGKEGKEGKGSAPAGGEGIALARRKFDAGSASSLSSALRDDDNNGNIDMLSTGFQSSKVGFSKGFAVGMDRPIDISATRTIPSKASSSSSASSASSASSSATPSTTTTTEKLFKVEEFSDPETDQKSKVIEFKAPASLSSQPKSKPSAQPKSILKKKPEQAPPVSLAPAIDQDEEDDDEDTDAQASNPWQANKRAAKPQLAKLDASNLKLLKTGTDEAKFNLLSEDGSGSSVRQETLVKEAFSITGEAEQLFAKEKNEVVSAALPKFEDNSLPGWGSWGGGNAKPRPLSEVSIDTTKKKHKEKKNKGEKKETLIEAK